MQLLHPETKRGAVATAAGAPEAGLEPTDHCADAVLDVAPPVVRAIRRMMREHRLPELSVPQFRTLALLSFNPEACLSVVADYIGSSLPAASRMMDGLVAKNLVVRTPCPRDRRQIALALTPLGRKCFLESRQATRRQLVSCLAGLSEPQKHAIVKAMKFLGEIFGSDAEFAKRNRRSRGRNQHGQYLD